MKIGLNLTERMRLMAILPQEESFFNLRAIRSLKDKIALQEDGSDDAKYGIVRTDEQIRWDPTKAKEEQDYEVGEVAMEIIKTALKKMNDEKKLNELDISLYDKFVEGKTSEPTAEA